MKLFSNIHLPYSKNKVVKDAFFLYFGRSINIVVGLGSTLIYGIVFLKSQIAVISLFEMIVNLFLTLGFTWSTLSLTRFGKEEIQKNQSINITSSIRIGIILPILFVSVLFIVYFQNNFLLYIGTVDNTIIIYLVFNLILLVIHEHIIYIFTTYEKHIQNVFYYLGLSIGKICILLFFYFNVLDIISAELYIKLNVYLLLVLFFIRMISIQYNYIFPIIISGKNDYLHHLKYVMPQIFGFAGLYILNWVDVYFIRKFLPYDDLGAYQFMYTIFVRISSFALILNTLFFPKIMSWKINNDKNIQLYLKKGPILMLLGSTICFLMFLSFYQPLFFIFFKNKYIISYSAFNVLILSLPFYFVSFLYIPVLNSFDRVKYIQIVFIVAAILNYLIDYIFIKDYGLIAAGFGKFIAYFSTYIMLSFAVGKMFKIRIKLLNLLSGLIFIAGTSYFFKTIAFSWK